MRPHPAYPELSAALGGAAAVPDLRGQFLRGVGGNSAPIGVAQKDATYIRAGEAKQTLFGAKKMDMINNPSGQGGNEGDYFPVFSVLTFGNNLSGKPGSTSPYPPDSTVDLNFQISTPGVMETRPTNVAVRYLIRALP
jgi:hypothetical protein